MIIRILCICVLALAVAGTVNNGATAQPLWVPPTPKDGGDEPKSPPLFVPKSADTPKSSNTMNYMRSRGTVDRGTVADISGNRSEDLRAAVDEYESRHEQIQDMLKNREQYLEAERQHIIQRLRNFLSSIRNFSIVGFVSNAVGNWVNNKINDLVQNNPITNKINEISSAIDNRVNDLRNKVNDVREVAEDVRDGAEDVRDFVKDNPPKKRPPTAGE